MVTVDLYYFSGTGNSYKILDTCKDIFIQNGCNTTLSSITDQSKISGEADFIGFCFPVYAFGIPRICRAYLQSLPKCVNKTKTFILITAGEQDESGFSIHESSNILSKKGFDVIYSAVIHMPANWTVTMNPPPKEKAQLIINNGINRAKKITKDILKGDASYHRFNYPSRISKMGFYKDYYLFKWFGVSNLWRNFRADETCDSCKLCSKICPTGSIHMIENKPEWSKTCEQCMRCVNYCPKQAIYQKGEGSIKGKNRYYEPSFKPLKIMKSQIKSRVKR